MHTKDAGRHICIYMQSCIFAFEDDLVGRTLLHSFINFGNQSIPLKSFFLTVIEKDIEWSLRLECCPTVLRCFRKFDGCYEMMI